MNTFLQGHVFIISFTFVVYFLAQVLQRKTKLVILNPILVSIVIIIVFLSVFKIDYKVYHEGSRLIDFFLKPAVVALGVPLYQQLEKIRKQTLHIVISEIAGCVAGIVSVVLLAKVMGAPREVVLSLAPKSVTTPIAIEVSKVVGGIPPLTASVVIVVGIFGSIYGYQFMKWAKVHNPVSQGLSMGTAAHAVGTSKSLEISPSFGAFSSLGLIMNGIFTAILTPYILALLGYLHLF
ncbi:LrgB family protein [Pedobacter sp. AW31-3R]|uniref:LrgB family protein n=1 Tax=Pedobacter sp. AW31-3R TaxID=3445781 RepID=UPI003FA0A55D